MAIEAYVFLGLRCVDRHPDARIPSTLDHVPGSETRR
jgi:hypothetical protein